MKQMMNWTKSVAMSTLLSVAAVTGMGITSIAAVSSQNTQIADESLTTLPTEGQEKLAYNGKCRRVATRHRNLRVRKHPWGKTLTVLHRGTRVNVIGYHKGWAKISHPCYGYVYAHYLKHC
jgi:hypothetical protein